MKPIAERSPIDVPRRSIPSRNTSPTKQSGRQDQEKAETEKELAEIVGADRRADARELHRLKLHPRLFRRERLENFRLHGGRGLLGRLSLLRGDANRSQLAEAAPPQFLGRLERDE